MLLKRERYKNGHTKKEREKRFCLSKFGGSISQVQDCSTEDKQDLNGHQLGQSKQTFSY